MEEEILKILQEQGVPVKSYALEHRLGICGADVREIVRNLRRKGYPICSGNSGYWIGSQEEIQHTINQLRSRGADMLQTANAMEQIALSGQLEVFAREV